MTDQEGRHRSMRATSFFAAVSIPLALALPTACAPRDAVPAASSQTESAAAAPPRALPGDSPREAQESGLNSLSDEERDAGFQLLFDGESLDEWRGYRRDDVPAGWSVENGTIHFSPGVEGGDIITRDQYDDFDLRLEWKILEGGNSGIMFRVSEDMKDTYRSGPEMQVLDDARHPDGQDPRTSAGANYGLHAPSVAAARPPGEWNEVRIIVQGNRVEYWLNGTNVVEYEIGSEAWEKLVAESKFAQWPTYGRNPQGHIALQDHGDEVWYRNLRILPMDR